MKQKNSLKVVLMIISIYTIIGIVLPIIFKYMIFENTAISNLSNNEWAGFLGSYVGGILGGLGTLIAVFITIRDSRNIQFENKKDTDQRILNETKERERLRIEDKYNSERNMRKEFTDEISTYIGKYITHISKYFYANSSSERLESEYTSARDKMIRIEKEIEKVDEHINNADINSEEYVKLQNERNGLLDRKSAASRIYNECKDERKKNYEQANRLIANECLFILRTKLNEIKDAEELLKQLNVFHNGGFYCNAIGEWLSENTELLIQKYNDFKEQYINRT